MEQRVLSLCDIFQGRAPFRRCALFGAGIRGAGMLRLLKHAGVEIEAVLDNDSGKRGTFFLGIPVLHPDEFAARSPLPVVVASNWQEEICTQLADMGRTDYYRLPSRFFDLLGLLGAEHEDLTGLLARFDETARTEGHGFDMHTLGLSLVAEYAPREAEDLARLSGALMARTLPNEARVLVEIGRKRHPDNQDLASQEAALALALGETRAAETGFTALREHRDGPEVRLELVRCAIQRYDYDAAQDLLRRAGEDYPGHAGLDHMRALLAHIMGDQELSRALYEDIAATHPDSAEIQFDRFRMKLIPLDRATPHSRHEVEELSDLYDFLCAKFPDHPLAGCAYFRSDMETKRILLAPSRDETIRENRGPGKRVLVIGDSHTVPVYAHENAFRRFGLRADVLHFPGASLAGLGNFISSFNLTDRISAYVERYAPDHVVLKLGQVDLDYGFHHRRIVKGRSGLDMDAFSRDIIARCEAFVERFKKVTDLSMAGINLPSVSVRENDARLTCLTIAPDLKLCGERPAIHKELLRTLPDLKGKTEIALRFNQTLKEFCAKNAVRHIDDARLFLDRATGLLKRDYQRLGDHHYLTREEDMDMAVRHLAQCLETRP